MSTTPELFNELESARYELIERLRLVDEKRLRVPGRDGSWCALEILAHVMGAEESSLQYIRKKLGDPASVPHAGIGSKLRSLALRFGLLLPFHYKAPAVVATPVPATSLDEAASRWEEIRNGWQELIDSFPEEMGSRAIFRHPVAGRLSLDDTLRFHRSHLSRHGGQIERCLSV